MKKLKLFALATAALLGFQVLQTQKLFSWLLMTFVGISFWVISMGMLAATVFFFMERGSVHQDGKLQ